jgi:hypothetical protein
MALDSRHGCHGVGTNMSQFILGLGFGNPFPNKIKRVWIVCAKTKKDLLVAYLKPNSNFTMLPCLHK